MLLYKEMPMDESTELRSVKPLLTRHPREDIAAQSSLAHSQS